MLGERIGMADINATFEIESWDEKPFDEGDGVPKLTRASVTKRYSGDVDGSSVTEWVMAYGADSSAEFVGFERIRGSIGGRHGSLVLQHVGTFRDGAARATITVVSGTSDLEGASGDGTFLADPSGKVTLRIDA
jgi:uncharacterized protein DUF3224